MIVTSPKALFLAAAVSMSPRACAPACPNCTSVVKQLAQVPTHQAITGFVMRPFFFA